MFKKIKIIVGASLAVVFLFVVIVVQSVRSSLPHLITVADYQPLLVSQIYDRNEKKVGEFFRERRILVPFDKIPKIVINAFLAAEDDQFFKHSGINILSIIRATLANMRAGRSVQGGSTITQQVAKTLLLSSEKTFTRKIKDILLALEMEKNLSKQDILYLYLNQIYFGQGAYGIELAAQTYFKKTVSQLTLAEVAVLAGLPQAPSRYSPVSNPQRAKERQLYVLRRMADVGFVSRAEAEKAGAEHIKVYTRENYVDTAPYYMEAIRQLLVNRLGEETVLDKGIKIYTSLDLSLQQAAQESVRSGLKDLDKRQGYRGAIKNLSDSTENIEKFLDDERKKLIAESTPERTILPDGTFAEIVPQKSSKESMPSYFKTGMVIKGVVENVNDSLGLVFVRLPEGSGVINFDTMSWARTPNPDVRFETAQIKKPSEALRTGDVIQVKLLSSQFKVPGRIYEKRKKETQLVVPDVAHYMELELDQDPLAEGALISFDQKTQDLVAMVGGFDFARSEFNRAIQAPRQTGSSFKALAYAAALDKGYTPATPIMDAPIVYEDSTTDVEGQEDQKVWKPSNHSKSFGGDIIFRNALVKSLNIPSVKITEDIGVPYIIDYAQRLGIFSPLNRDFTLVLGSSSVTLYEMTKAFAQFGLLGKRMRPIIIKKVTDSKGTVLFENMSLDSRFANEMDPIEKSFEERRENFVQLTQQSSLTPEASDGVSDKLPASDKKINPNDENFFFEDVDQLIKPQTAYLMTSLLRGVVEDRFGTGGRARALGREVAGKTGTTNNYYDAWFIGYTPQVSTGVWMGFDHEKTLGKGEVGGRAALPAWVEYMKAAHDGVPPTPFPVPDKIVFANIDAETGKLASAATKYVLKQAFFEGTEPTGATSSKEEDTNFYKDDLSE